MFPGLAEAELVEEKPKKSTKKGRKGKRARPELPKEETRAEEETKKEEPSALNVKPVNSN